MLCLNNPYILCLKYELPNFWFIIIFMINNCRLGKPFQANKLIIEGIKFKMEVVSGYGSGSGWIRIIWPDPDPEVK